MSIDTDTDVDILSDLDFEPVLACEHKYHPHTHIPDDPAAWVIRGVCICGFSVEYLLCESGRIDQISHPVHCPGCGVSGTVDDFWVSCTRLDIQ